MTVCDCFKNMKMFFFPNSGSSSRASTPQIGAVETPDRKLPTKQKITPQNKIKVPKDKDGKEQMILVCHSSLFSIFWF